MRFFSSPPPPLNSLLCLYLTLASSHSIFLFVVSASRRRLCCVSFLTLPLPVGCHWSDAYWRSFPILLNTRRSLFKATFSGLHRSRLSSGLLHHNTRGHLIIHDSVWKTQAVQIFRRSGRTAVRAPACLLPPPPLSDCPRTPVNKLQPPSDDFPLGTNEKGLCAATRY